MRSPEDSYQSIVEEPWRLPAGFEKRGHIVLIEARQLRELNLELLTAFLTFCAVAFMGVQHSPWWLIAILPTILVPWYRIAVTPGYHKLRERFKFCDNQGDQISEHDGFFWHWWVTDDIPIRPTYYTKSGQAVILVSPWKESTKNFDVPVEVCAHETTPNDEIIELFAACCAKEYRAPLGTPR